MAIDYREIEDNYDAFRRSSSSQPTDNEAEATRRKVVVSNAQAALRSLQRNSVDRNGDVRDESGNLVNLEASVEAIRALPNISMLAEYLNINEGLECAKRMEAEFAKALQNTHLNMARGRLVKLAQYNGHKADDIEHLYLEVLHHLEPENSGLETDNKQYVKLRASADRQRERHHRDGLKEELREMRHIVRAGAGNIDEHAAEADSHLRASRHSGDEFFKTEQKIRDMVLEVHLGWRKHLADLPDASTQSASTGSPHNPKGRER